MQSCPNCGAPIYEGASVCPNCGQNIFNQPYCQNQQSPPSPPGQSYEQPYYPRSDEYYPPQPQPQQPPPPPYPPYPPYQHPPPVKSTLPIIIVVVVVVAVLAVVFGVILMSSSSDDSGVEVVETEESPKITMRNPDEYSYGYSLEIVAVSGGSLRLEDAKFQIFDANGVRRYEVFTADANPASLTLGVSKVYAIPSGSNPVTDFTTGNTITASTTFANYQNCTLAYLDANDDSKVTAGDRIYLYRDVDDDGTDDISAGYVLKIFKGGDFTGEKEL